MGTVSRQVSAIMSDDGPDGGADPVPGWGGEMPLPDGGTTIPNPDGGAPVPLNPACVEKNTPDPNEVNQDAINSKAASALLSGIVSKATSGVTDPVIAAASIEFSGIVDQKVSAAKAAADADEKIPEAYKQLADQICNEDENALTNPSANLPPPPQITFPVPDDEIQIPGLPPLNPDAGGPTDGGGGGGDGGS